MSKCLERAKELRGATDVHYNCCQSVLLPFAEQLGVDGDTALKTAACFGSGMNMGSVCGAVTGGLMVLGLAGAGDTATAQAFLKKIRENHDGLLNCKDLLRVNAEKGGKRKTHCDGMVYEAIEAVEEILAAKE